ncbi:nucleoside diphosphate kinase regulator [Lysobacter sp. GX 14042]|uniref:nucleoside diphosphate kinase regulator n=1 Tax=Lysobacter sp. GX 14042 TaxID=2907155 RepID=UPI001F303B61|nr:nucleoside diphosphate kinase regulator [Lysobacter sp. GX 14042]MCE7033189.1 nucleoside diphosphate kinase regulator [Lysobacter sp. GX 14042]
MNTPPRPPLVISRIDCERLEALLEKRLPPGLDVDALRDELARAEVLEPGDMPGDVITMNSTARFVDEANGAEHEITLVYPHEMDGSSGKVSILAPVGSALLGLHVGDRIEWPAPGARRLTLRVLSIK